MLERLMFIVFPILGVVTSVGIAMVVVLMAIRSWHQLRSGDDETRDDELLDGIERLEVQLGALSRRLARLEQAALPPADDEPAATPAEPSDGVG